MIIAGIDWANDHHDVVVLGEGKKQLASFRINHNAAGIDKLCRKLTSIGGSPQAVACVLETNNGLLVTALLEAGFKVYPVNPKTIERKRRPSGAKTDQIDALLLARHGYNELDELCCLEPDSPIIQELKTLTRDQQRLIQEKTRLLNQMTACLKDYYRVALRFFSRLDQPSTMAFLRAYPTLEAVRASHAGEIGALLKQHGHRQPNKTAQRIVALAQEPQLQASLPRTRAKMRLLLALVAQLVPLVDVIKEYDKAIHELFTAHSDSEIFQSLPGAGMRLAPRLLAEWSDDRSRYLSHESVAALAGTAPVPNQSGKRSVAEKRKACVRPFRHAMYQFAWNSTRMEPWAKEYYVRKRQEGKSHSVAVRALSNVWVRIIYRMWLNRTEYDAKLFLAARTAHSPRVAVA